MSGWAPRQSGSDSGERISTSWPSERGTSHEESIAEPVEAPPSGWNESRWSRPAEHARGREQLSVGSFRTQFSETDLDKLDQSDGGADHEQRVRDLD